MVANCLDFHRFPALAPLPGEPNGKTVLDRIDPFVDHQSLLPCAGIRTALDCVHRNDNHESYSHKHLDSAGAWGRTYLESDPRDFGR